MGTKMRNSFTLIIFVFYFFLSSFAEGMSISNRGNSVEPDLLPHGLWLTGFDYGFSQGNSEKFNSSGQKVSFNSSLSQDLKVKDLLASIQDQNEKAVAKAAFRSFDLNEDTNAGTVRNFADVKYSSETFILGRGISDSFSLFLIAPKISLDIQFQTEMQYSPQIKTMVQSLRSQGQHSKADEIEQQEKNALASQLSKNAYDKDYVSSWQGIPQVHLMAKYRIDHQALKAVTFDTTFVIPTEKDIYSSQFMPLDFFEESPSLIQSVYYSPWKTESMRLSALASYQLRTPFRKQSRIPVETKGDFTSDVETVDVKYGNEYRLGTQFDFNYKKWGKFFAHTNFIGKNEDRYQGKDFSSDRYELMEQETQQELILLGTGLQLNLVDAFLRGHFIVPMIVTTQYSKALNGRNTFANEFYGINAMVFIQ